jgi:hypothetical protein
MFNTNEFISLLRKHYSTPEGTLPILHDFIEEYLPAGQFKFWQTYFSSPIAINNLFFDLIIRYGTPKQKKFLTQQYKTHAANITRLNRKNPSYPRENLDLIKKFSLEELLRLN